MTAGRKALPAGLHRGLRRELHEDVRAAHPARILALAAALLVAGLAGPAPATGQERAADHRAAARAQAGEEPLVEAPFQFRVGPTAGVLAWDEPGGDGVQRMDETTMWGLDVASVVGRYAGFRLGGAVGGTEIASGGPRFEAVQYLVDVLAEGRLAAGPLYRAGVIPYLTVGAGAVVHDPAPDSLVTRSQSVFTWGAGVEARLLDRIGARAEWRRVQAEIQDAADPVDRTGTTRFADRFFLGVYWVL